MFRHLFVFTFLLLVASFAKAQPYLEYSQPMKIPPSLSANFAELRPNHFHSGLDFRTGGKEGEPLYSVADGYINRIVVRHNGYGKALYIKHPNGATSVYAHMLNFAPEVDRWIKNTQYRRKVFYTDIQLDSSTFPVKRGQFIGNSGNSGRSFGAHLHFEIRDENQIPFNLISQNIYRIEDDIPPFATRLYIYSFDSIGNSITSKIEKAFKIKSSGSKLSISAGDTIDVPSTCYFGLDMQDRINGTTSRFGIYSFEMHINEAPYFSLAMDNVSFDETRYANAFMDCGEKERVNRYVSRLYVMPNNRLNIYKYALNNGVVHVPKGETVKVNMYLTDDSKNVSELKFWVRGTGDNPRKTRLDKKNIAYWNKAFTFEMPAFRMEIPAGTLYESSLIEVKALGAAHGSLSQVYQVIKPETPPHKSVSIGIRASIPKKLWNKIAVVCMDKKGNKSALKTSYSAPYFMADTRSWGYFFIELDTTPPVVSPMNFIPNTTLKQSSIKLKVFDNLSSLKSFGGYIDGEWALFDYDEKSNTMTYEVDSTRIKHTGEHDIRFLATDMLDNTTEFRCNLSF